MDDKEMETKTVVEAHLYTENAKLRDAIKAAQGILMKRLVPGGITSEEAISDLLGVLDNQDLFNTLRGDTAKGHLEFELEKLEVKDGGIVLVKYPSSSMSAVDCHRFATALNLSLSYQNAKNVNIIFIEGETDIKTLSESDMNRAGWLRVV